MKVTNKRQVVLTTQPEAPTTEAKTHQVGSSGLVRAPHLVAQAPSEKLAEVRSSQVGFRRLRKDHLTSGKKFDRTAAEALKTAAGLPVSLDALTRLYDKALPSSGGLAPTRVRITGAKERDHFAFTVTFVDNMQKRIATARRRLVRHEDGSIELYRHGTWVDPAHRGRGFAAHMLRQEVGLLTALSDHPQSRLTLWAGGARNPYRAGEHQAVGVYVWARAGFEAAATPSTLAPKNDKPRCEGDPGREALSDMGLLRQQLGVWLDARVEAGELSAEERAALSPQVEACAQPADICDLALDGKSFEAKVGDQTRSCRLGQAFLLSPLAPRWEGALYVNQGDSPAYTRAEQYVKAAQASQGTGEARIVEGWKADLASDDPARHDAALVSIGRAGGTGMVPALEDLAKRRPELADVVRTTISKVRGRYKPPRPKITYSGHGGRMQGFSLPKQFAELEKFSPGKLASVAIGDDDFRRSQAALQQLADKHVAKAPKVVQEAAEKVYDRFTGDDDRWLARQTAVRILSKLPEEAGVAALVKASKVEDDINVMIAIHRALDMAEHPTAVEPAEALSDRIEQMKAEIERALAEL